MPVITVSGFHGVGKSEVARYLAKNLNLRYVSAGAIFRQEAAKRGLSLEEFSRIAKDNPAIDRLIDERTREEAKKGNVVLDGLLAGRMAREYADVKIRLYAPLDVRVRRIAERDKKPYEEALHETIIRETLERERFYEFYAIDLDDLRIYDIVLNTAKLTLQDLREIVLISVKRMLSLSGGDRNDRGRQDRSEDYGSRRWTLRGSSEGRRGRSASNGS